MGTVLLVRGPAAAGGLDGLVATGHQIQATDDVERAASRLRFELPDACVLAGFEPEACVAAVRRLRHARWIGPIVVLSGRVEDDLTLRLFEAGVDEHVTLAAPALLLRARLDALIRLRVRAGPGGDGHSFPGLRIEWDLRRACLTSAAGARSVAFAPQEFRLLWLLVEHAGRVLSRDALRRGAWGTEEPDRVSPARRDRRVDVHVKRLRDRLEHPEYAYVHTHRMLGYRFEPEPRPARAFPGSNRGTAGPSRDPRPTTIGRATQSLATDVPRFGE